MRQSEFFRALVTGYLEEDEDIISFLTSYKEEHGRQSGRQQKLALAERKESTQQQKMFAEDEIENIFSMIEKENPDL